MKLVVALDLPTPDANLDLVEKLRPERRSLALKVGLNTFTALGPPFVQALKKFDFEVILDLKLYDIPNTMANAAKQIAALGVDMFTIHASAGPTAMEAVMKAMREYGDPNANYFTPKVLAVTVLTSFSSEECEGIYHSGPKHTAQCLAMGAMLAGVDGVVCSPKELPEIQMLQSGVDSLASKKIIKFVPGIELAPRKDDQKRKGSLADVAKAQADYIVVGRPIYEAPSPLEVVYKILDKIKTITEAVEQIEKAAKWE